MSPGQPLLVGVDVGTTRTKAAVFGVDGCELSRHAEPTVWRRTAQGTEASPGDFVAGARRALAGALAGAPAGEVLGVGVTGMAETNVLIDEAGRALGPAIAWYDRRAEPEFVRLNAELTPAEIAHRTGLSPDLVPTISVLGWLMRTEPELRRARATLSIAEWVVFSLGGAVAAEASLASRTAAYAVAAGGWWTEAIACAGLEPALFPEIRQAGSSWGILSTTEPDLERVQGAVLTVAGHDHLVASIGSGAIASHQAMDSCGTAEALLRAVPVDLQIDPAQGVPLGISTGRHLLADHYVLLAGLPLGIELIPLLQRLGESPIAGRTALDAGALEWLAATGGSDEPGAREGADAAAGGSSAEREWAAGVSAAVDRAARALANMIELGGPITELVVSGGWAANPVLRRLKRQAFAPTTFSAVVEAGARGAALLAGQAAGVFDSVEAFPAPGEGRMQPTRP